MKTHDPTWKHHLKTDTWECERCGIVITEKEVVENPKILVATHYKPR